MIDYTYKDLYYEDSVDKQLKIVAEDGTVITNEDIYMESMTLDESLCSEEDLTFGLCEASKFYIKIAYRFTPLYGQWLDVSETIGGHTDDPFVFGRYKVQSDEPTADRVYREITAYDAIYDIINADREDVGNWYHELLPSTDSTVTLREFRKSFIEHFGIEEEDTALVNDDMIVEKTLSATEISGKDIINSICEINGVFGHINRNGKFEYISLSPIGTETEDYIYLSGSQYRSCSYEDYETETIDKIQIKQEDGDVGCNYGEGENVYTINGNFLAYGKTEDELIDVAKNIYSNIAGLIYRPAEVKAMGNPCIMVGDAIGLKTKYQDVYTYVLCRSLSGIQGLVDTYTAEGSEIYVNSGNNLETEITDIRGKSNVFERTLERTESRITDIEKDVKDLSDDMIVETYWQYYLSSSPDEPIDGEWLDELPTDEEWPDDDEKYYIWIRNVVVTGSGVISVSDPVCVTPEDERSVINITAYYSISSSKDICPSFNSEESSLLGIAILGKMILGESAIWTTDIPDVGPDDYLWVSLYIEYSDGTDEWTAPTCLTDASLKAEVSKLSERTSTIEQTVDSIILEIESITTTFYETYETVVTEISEISMEVGNITLTVSQLEEGFETTNEKISEIEMSIDSISLTVSDTNKGTASIILTVNGEDAGDGTVVTDARTAFENETSSIEITAGVITFSSNTIIIDSTNFSVTSTGVITAKSGTIGGFTISTNKLYAGADDEYSKTIALQRPRESGMTWAIAVGGESHEGYSDCPFRVRKDGVTYVQSLYVYDALHIYDTLTESNVTVISTDNTIYPISGASSEVVFGTGSRPTIIRGDGMYFGTSSSQFAVFNGYITAERDITMAAETDGASHLWTYGGPTDREYPSWFGTSSAGNVGIFDTAADYTSNKGGYIIREDIDFVVYVGNSNTPENRIQGKVIYVGGSATSETDIRGSEVHVQSAYDNTTSNSANVHVGSAGLLARYQSSSSIRYKDVIRELTPDDVSKLYDIVPIWFSYKEQYLSSKDERYMTPIPGFIAENWNEIMPIAVDHGDEGLPESWNCNIVVPLMFEMIKCDHSLIQNVDDRVFSLEIELEQAKEEIAALKEQLSGAA